MAYESPLRDLIRRLRATASDHPAYSQAAAALANLYDHLSALARIEEVNRKLVNETEESHD